MVWAKQLLRCYTYSWRSEEVHISEEMLESDLLTASSHVHKWCFGVLTVNLNAQCYGGAELWNPCPFDIGASYFVAMSRLSHFIGGHRRSTPY